MLSDNTFRRIGHCTLWQSHRCTMHIGSGQAVCQFWYFQMDAQSTCYSKMRHGQSPDNARIQTLYNATKSLILEELNDYKSDNHSILAELRIKPYMAYFTLITSPYEVTSGGGGGGLQSNLKWGARPKGDEIEFARRCAQAASNRIGRHPEGG